MHRDCSIGCTAPKPKALAAAANNSIHMRVRTMPQKTIPFSLKLDNIIAKEAVALGCITLFMVIGYAAINSFLLVYAEEKHIAGGALPIKSRRKTPTVGPIA